MRLVDTRVSRSLADSANRQRVGGTEARQSETTSYSTTGVLIFAFGSSSNMY